MKLIWCTVFDAVWSVIDNILFINPSANAFVSGDFNVHQNGGTDRPGELGQPL